MFIRSAFNYDVDAASAETGILIDEPSLAQQSFCEECDINTIVRRFGITGELPQNARLPTYDDFSGVSDYQSALDALSQAQEAFMPFPGDIRAKFDHDPGLFVDFCSDPANLPALREMGLALPSTSAVEQPEAAISG